MKSDLFGKSGMKWLAQVELPVQERRLLNGELELLSLLNDRIKGSDRWLSELAKDNKEVNLLRSVPGIGLFLAVLIWAEIDGIERFSDPKKLASYAGLVPSTYSSGGKTYHGRLTKQGNKWIRWAVIEAALPATRSDYWLRSHYEQIKIKKGANLAKVAVARRLLVIVFRILKEKRSFRVADKNAIFNVSDLKKRTKSLAAPVCL